MIKKESIKRNKGKILVVALLLSGFTFLSLADKDFQIAKNLDIFYTLFREVNMFYVDETSPEDLISNGIDGMLENLDPYTTYIPESETDDFKFMTTGQYGGIGALIRRAGEYTMISEPYEGFPAQRAGLCSGDTLLVIDSVSTRGKEISDVSELLKGKPGTTVSMIISRPGVEDTIKISFKREKVTINNVSYYGILDNKIGYIQLTNFTKDAANEVKEAFTELKDKGIEYLILDLRGNPGGLLNEAVDIANIWIPKNQEIVSTRGKVKQWDKSYITSNNPVDTSMPMAVLVNRGSASASEIVAGALQDLDRAVIIGSRTFGKGLVQTTRQLSYNTHLKITTAKYYIPSGRCIQALDYSHRNEDGSVGHIPDSLKTAFETKNGRTVYDGGGIEPDINTDKEKAQNISYALYASNTFFDFATQYAIENDSIPLPDQFEITDELYDEFIEFAKANDIDYHSRSNEKFKELLKVAKEESYYSISEEEFAALEEKLKVDLKKDMVAFRYEIQDLLKEEITSRYYYQKGRILSTLNDDDEVLKAIEALKDEEKVAKILHLNMKHTGELQASSK